MHRSWPHGAVLYRMLSLVLLHSMLATCTHHPAATAPDSGLVEALSQHVGKLGPLNPETLFTEQLAAAAIYVPDADDPSLSASVDTSDTSASEGCYRMPLVLMTVADEHAMQHYVSKLVASLAAIPAQDGSKTPQAPVSSQACAGAHIRWQPPQAQQDQRKGGKQGRTRDRAQRELGGQSKDSEDAQGQQALTLASALLVIAANGQAGMLCRDIASKAHVRCYQSSHIQTDISTTMLRHHGATLHLAFARARHILNALTLGYGVLFVDAGVRVLEDPLTPALQRPEDAVHLPAASSSHQGRCSGVGSVSGERGVLLVRPSSAAARCLYDWVVAMKEAALREGTGMHAANASIHDQYHAVVPACLSVLGPGYATVEEPVFAECIDATGGR